MTATIKFPRLSFDWNITPQQFINFWSNFYNYPQEHLYHDNINKGTFSASDVENLFLWKNGMKLSGKKLKALREITRHLDVINRLKADFSLDAFQNVFDKVTTIWKIFLLHITLPQCYPIFDQHVFRAFRFLRYNSLSGSPTEQVYLQEYVLFFDTIVETCGTSRKETDEALMMFGKFLKTPHGGSLCTLQASVSAATIQQAKQDAA
ncbi:MAG: hypothetical protein EHM45_06085 [Desulfobacteraceae bacterium]|nr:MAG: hypothetical protein EHM45_06085 [Desulfobacteraceae bacterium]